MTDLRADARSRRAALRECRRRNATVLGEIIGIDPAHADQRPVEVMLDHPLDRPGLSALGEIETPIEIDVIFAFDIGADKGGVGNALSAVIDIGHLPFRRILRPCRLLLIGQAGHLELDFRLGNERADFRQAKACTCAVKDDHVVSPSDRDKRLGSRCRHRGVSSRHAGSHRRPRHASGPPRWKPCASRARSGPSGGRPTGREWRVPAAMPGCARAGHHAKMPPRLSKAVIAESFVRLNLGPV